MHLGTIWIQGSMRIDDPTALVHEYIQRMMAWLLFVDADTVPQRQALQLGLGAASLTKFCANDPGSSLNDPGSSLTFDTPGALAHAAERR